MPSENSGLPAVQQRASRSCRAGRRSSDHFLPRSKIRLQIQDLDKALSLIPGKHRLPEKQLMLLVREGDRRESSLIRQGKGYIHISGMGHEPLAVLNYHLHKEDYLFTYYRDRSLMIARGMTPQQFANDYFASAKSSTGGRGMPVHSSSKSLNIFPPATPTGSQCLPAVGAAWGIKMANQDGVVICTIGDASVRQGEFYAFAVASEPHGTGFNDGWRGESHSPRWLGKVSAHGHVWRGY